jgi:hypothetical protein
MTMEGLKLPAHVGGDLNLSGLTTAEGVKLPESVAGDLNLSGLTTAEGLKLPEHVSGDLDLSGLTTAEGLKLPLHVGGDIYLWSLDKDEYDQEVHGPRELNGRVGFHRPIWRCGYSESAYRAASSSRFRSRPDTPSYPAVFCAS